MPVCVWYLLLEDGLECVYGRRVVWGGGVEGEGEIVLIIVIRRFC
jgi:hypothetical protein